MNTIFKSASVSLVIAIVVTAVSLAMYHQSQIVHNTQTVAKGIPDFSNSQYIVVNGVQNYFYRVPMNGGTTTPCSILTPAATSSLIFMSMATNVATNTAVTWTIATSTTAFASTSLLNQYIVAANQNAYLSQEGSTSPITGANWQTIPPNTYVNWTENITPATFSTAWPSGFCQAQVIVL